MGVPFLFTLGHEERRSEQIPRVRSGLGRSKHPMRLLWMVRRNPILAPPKAEAQRFLIRFPNEQNQQMLWFQPGLQSGAKWISPIHRIPKAWKERRLATWQSGTQGKHSPILCPRMGWSSFWESLGATRPADKNKSRERWRVRRRPATPAFSPGCAHPYTNWSAILMMMVQSYSGNAPFSEQLT